MGGVDQSKPAPWSSVTTGSAPVRSTEPRAESQFWPCPNQIRPSAKATVDGLVPSPVGYSAVTRSAAVSMATILSAYGTAAYSVPESGLRARSVTSGRPGMVASVRPVKSVATILPELRSLRNSRWWTPSSTESDNHVTGTSTRLSAAAGLAAPPTRTTELKRTANAVAVEILRVRTVTDTPTV